MDRTLVSTLIAALGVFISSFFAYRIAARQGAHRFNELLYQARLSSYPKLYSICSRLAKLIRFAEITQETLQQYRTELDAWDNESAILLSPISAKAVFDLRLTLANLLTTSNSLHSQGVKANLVDNISSVENALKTELGVFDLSSYHKPSKVEDAFQQLPKNLRR